MLSPDLQRYSWMDLPCLKRQPLDPLGWIEEHNDAGQKILLL